MKPPSGPYATSDALCSRIFAPVARAMVDALRILDMEIAVDAAASPVATHDPADDSAQLARSDHAERGPSDKLDAVASTRSDRLEAGEPGQTKHKIPTITGLAVKPSRPAHGLPEHRHNAVITPAHADLPARPSQGESLAWAPELDRPGPAPPHVGAAVSTRIQVPAPQSTDDAPARLPAQPAKRDQPGPDQPTSQIAAPADAQIPVQRSAGESSARPLDLARRESARPPSAPDRPDRQTAVLDSRVVESRPYTDPAGPRHDPARARVPMVPTALPARETRQTGERNVQIEMHTSGAAPVSRERVRHSRPMADLAQPLTAPPEAVLRTTGVALVPRSQRTTVASAVAAIEPVLERAHQLTMRALEGPARPAPQVPSGPASPAPDPEPANRVHNTFNVKVAVTPQDGSGKLDHDTRDALEEALIDILRAAARRHGLDV
ncbi:MAG: hypothetical protein MJE77_33035 [Proteobacteria bacterium]|nr:hypothetical protein [Pseudomonadota bacterium]